MTQKLNDGLVSAANSMGERSRARTYTNNRKVTDSILEVLYENNWIVQNFIDGTTSDMLRKDREIKTELTPQQDAMIEQFSRKHSLPTVMERYLNWGRLYGDSIIIAVTKFVTAADPVDMSKPLNLDTEKLSKFVVLDKRSYTPSSDVIDNLANPMFGEPINYEVKIGNTEQIIHPSRLQRLSCGDRPVSKIIRGGKQSYGVSEVKAIWDALTAYDAAKLGISDLIDLVKTTIVKAEGYNHAVKMGGEQDFVELGMAMKRSMSLANILFLDGNSTYESHEFTSTWVNEALKESRIDLAGAMGKPIIRVFGMGSSGFASGEEDNKIYYERINAKQESQVRPLWDFLDQFIIDDLKDRDPDFNQVSFDYSFPTIRDRDEKELAEIANLFADFFTKLYDVDAIDALQIAKEIKNRGFMASITDEDLEKLEAIVNDPSYEKPQNEESYSF